MLIHVIMHDTSGLKCGHFHEITFANSSAILNMSSIFLILFMDVAASIVFVLTVVLCLCSYI